MIKIKDSFDVFRFNSMKHIENNVKIILKEKVSLLTAVYLLPKTYNDSTYVLFRNNYNYIQPTVFYYDKRQ